jgi:hypothetical protein
MKPALFSRHIKVINWLGWCAAGGVGTVVWWPPTQEASRCCTLSITAPKAPKQQLQYQHPLRLDSPIDCCLFLELDSGGRVVDSGALWHGWVWSLIHPHIFTAFHGAKVLFSSFNCYFQGPPRPRGAARGLISTVYTFLVVQEHRGTSSPLTPASMRPKPATPIAHLPHHIAHCSTGVLQWLDGSTVWLERLRPW